MKKQKKEIIGKLSIKNIGAITKVDLDITRFNIFIGPQSSGKSTISKILCFCMWVEKDCYLDKDRQQYHMKDGVFYDSLVEYHHLEGYFNTGASIKYEGEYLSITYTHSSHKTTIRASKSIETVYCYPKVCYIPSERNIVTAVDNFSSGSDALYYFKNDWDEARASVDTIALSNILERNIKYEYDQNKKKNFFYDGNKRMPLTNASSGVMSLTPLYVILYYMYTKIYDDFANKSLSKQSTKKYILELFSHLRVELLHSTRFSVSEWKESIELLKIAARSLELGEVRTSIKDDKEATAQMALDATIEIDRLFEYKYTQLFIEEPEQNLFPRAQRKFIYELFKLISISDKSHRAVITTHSPYVLYALNNCIMGGLVGEYMPEEEREELESYNSNAWINPKHISLWQIENGELISIENEQTGTLGSHYFNKVSDDTMSEYYEMLTYLRNDNEE
ncbi:MAG: AAA family ATPase [Rikenellaceae bacterium]